MQSKKHLRNSEKVHKDCPDGRETTRKREMQRSPEDGQRRRKEKRGESGGE